MNLKFEKRFLKKLSKLLRKDQIKILVKFKIFKETEKANLVKLEGYDSIYRLREGEDWMVFDVEKRERAYR